jgi:glycosyltransferase involved in cell wall biosynthesis
MVPTVALCVICKNEEKNLPRLLASVEGCFDEIHIADTGSTDGTIEYLKSRKDVTLHHFTWVDDFSAARNFVFSKAKADYVMWLDCDDVLDSKEQFIEWKKALLITANYWMAAYHYGLDDKGEPTCSFARERVIKNGMGYEWNHFVHEGIPPVTKVGKAVVSYASSWAVKHVRTQEDINADRNRNLRIFQKNPQKMNDRLEYYYGKELFEAQQPLEAYTQLTKAMELPQLELHDRVLCIQYACMSAMNCNQFDKAIELAHKGLRLVPNRAEFYVIIADSYLKLNKFDDSVPYYVAASACNNPTPKDAVFQQPIFTDAKVYAHYPRNQLARVYFHKGEINKAKQYLEEALALGPDTETGTLYTEILAVEKATQIKPRGSLPQADEYVITCPQVAMYLWDENECKRRGVGGSETAAIRMARELHKLTGKKVRIFMDRPNEVEIDGVYYIPHAKTRDYFMQYEPKAHIAWRHNVKITNAPTFVWCHDMAFPDFDKHQNFDAVLALSEFHKSYLIHTLKIPKEKIILTRNGIDLERFSGTDFTKKNDKKIVFSSSPDRGLDNAIEVVKRARELSGIPFELHAFYGLDNMAKIGRHDEVARFKKLIADNSFVKFHGNVQQDELIKHFADAKVWLYPTYFLETFCITALEMLACQVRPLVRAYGALPFTLKDLPAEIIHRDCANDDDINAWAGKLVLASGVDQPKVDMSAYTWESVAKEWLTWLPH